MTHLLCVCAAVKTVLSYLINHGDHDDLYMLEINSKVCYHVLKISDQTDFDDQWDFNGFVSTALVTQARFYTNKIILLPILFLNKTLVHAE